MPRHKPNALGSEAGLHRCMPVYCCYWAHPQAQPQDPGNKTEKKGSRDKGHKRASSVSKLPGTVSKKFLWEEKRKGRKWTQRCGMQGKPTQNDKGISMINSKVLPMFFFFFPVWIISFISDVGQILFIPQKYYMSPWKMQLPSPGKVRERNRLAAVQEWSAVPGSLTFPSQQRN